MLSVENRSALDQKVGPEKEVELLDVDGIVNIMAFKMKKAGVKQIIAELNKASKTHKGQADRLEKMISSDSSPLKGKISGPCKTAAKSKFDVWPSAYASGWGVRCTKAGGPGKMGKKKK